jgi:hypothetical protein
MSTSTQGVLLIDGNNYADKFAVGNAVGWSAGVQIQYCLISTTGRINWYTATPTEFASLIGGGGGGGSYPSAGVAVSGGSIWDASFPLTTAGQMFVSNGIGGLTPVAAGSAGQLLTWPTSGNVPIFQGGGGRTASFYIYSNGGHTFTAPTAPVWWTPPSGTSSGTTYIVPPATGGSTNVTLPFAVSISVVECSTSDGNGDCWTVTAFTGGALTISNTTNTGFAGNVVLLITYYSSSS